MIADTRAVFLDYGSLEMADTEFDGLRQTFSDLVMFEKCQATQVAERLRGAPVAIVNKALVGADVFKACPDLRLVLVAATGTNNVDLDAARKQGVTVCNCQAYGTASVAQHTLLLLLALAGRLQEYNADVRSGRWARAEQFCLLDHPMMELAGKTLGIVGLGELGSAVARLATAFDMQVRVAQLPGRPARDGAVPFDELLPQVDALSLHCPLTDATRNLIDAPQLAAMKPGAFLINTARGGLVNEQALADALRRGHLGGAAFDVLTEEPPRNGNALLAQDIPRLLVTPHCAWGTLEARRRVLAQIIENASAFFDGKPRRVVS